MKSEYTARAYARVTQEFSVVAENDSEAHAEAQRDFADRFPCSVIEDVKIIGVKAIEQKEVVAEPVEVTEEKPAEPVAGDVTETQVQSQGTEQAPEVPAVSSDAAGQ